MASNPPFQVEDQTDEDFFDKLVNEDDDDVDLKVSATSLSVSSAPVFTDGNESDEIKAFANLSISEVEDSEANEKKMATDDSGGKFESGPNGEVKEVVEGDTKQIVESEQGVAEECNGALESSNSFDFGALESSNSFDFGALESAKSIEFANAFEGNKENAGAEILSNSTVGDSSQSGAVGVKEVLWSSFNTNREQKDSTGFGSYSDFFSELGESAGESSGNVANNFGLEETGNDVHDSAYMQTSIYGNYQDGYNYGADGQQTTGVQDQNSLEYLESLYPGWKYDPTTGQWYKVDDYNLGANVQGVADSNLSGDWAASDGKTDVSYLQNSVQSVTETVAASGTTGSVTNWNQVSHLNDATGSESNWNQLSQAGDTGGSTLGWNQVSSVNNEYPPHMVFDPQYPDWYYDTNAQEWRKLETYIASLQSAAETENQVRQNETGSIDTFSGNDNQRISDKHGHVGNYSLQGFGAEAEGYSSAGSFDHYNQQGPHIWQPETAVNNTRSSLDYRQSQPLENHYGQNFGGSNHTQQQLSSSYGGTVPYYEKASEGKNQFSAIGGSQNFVNGGNFSHQFNLPRNEQKEHNHVSGDYFSFQNSVNFSQPLHGAHQFSHAQTPARSSAGRPPCALVTFGFGGKLIVAKGSDSVGASAFGSQVPIGSSISVLNFMEVVAENVDASDYFRALCRQSFPGPFTGGSAGLNKWIDERISNSESTDLDYRKGEVLRLLLSLLKISVQYQGKLRSPFGADSLLNDNEAEAAIAKLFASSRMNGTQFSDYGSIGHCLQKLPSEGQLQATAAEVQSLLVCGRKKEALHCAQEGQLWGPALVLAAQLGDQFYVDTVKQMALRQLVSGSPLRTLCLLIAGQPADVFKIEDASANNSMYGAVNINQQPTQFGVNGMLHDWKENLAVITANRTKDDEFVLIHLGDCLWKENSDVVAAHMCYLVAEANFEPYSDKARLCLVGADHWKFPRTYASPDAIQRTEIYEYSKVLGNPQFILLPFQPYKLVYAHMLVEVGRVSDALKYCQAVLKALKNGRSPEVETLRLLASSLEDRIKSYQQGGFSANLAPGKLVGKLLNLFDSTAHRVVGGLPPVPSTSGGSVQSTEIHHQMGPRVSTSQSTMAMSSLVPSSSMEPINEWATDGNRRPKHNRSVSEPDFGRTPRQDQGDTSKEASSTNAQGESSGGGTSRFGRFAFGSQIFQKTVGLVLKPRQGRQAKLGDENKFYFDKQLNTWVEKGAEPPAMETVLPPPPSAAFQNGTADYNLKTALKSEGSLSNGSPEFKSPSLDQGAGIPPLPPTSNQFSARSRMGVRSRYVDTFNKGGGNQPNLFQSPSVSSIKPSTRVNANAKFFVPAPISSSEETSDNNTESIQDTNIHNENPSIPSVEDSFHSPPPPSSVNMQRFGSMGSISTQVMTVKGSFLDNSRRTASWSGSFHGSFSPEIADVKPLGEVLGMHQSPTLPPGDSSLVHSSAGGGSFGDELHEVEL